MTTDGPTGIVSSLASAGPLSSPGPVILRLLALHLPCPATALGRKSGLAPSAPPPPPCLPIQWPGLASLSARHVSWYRETRRVPEASLEIHPSRYEYLGPRHIRSSRTRYPFSCFLPVSCLSMMPSCEDSTYIQTSTDACLFSTRSRPFLPASLSVAGGSDRALSRRLRSFPGPCLFLTEEFDLSLGMPLWLHILARHDP